MLVARMQSRASSLGRRLTTRSVRSPDACETATRSVRSSEVCETATKSVQSPDPCEREQHHYRQTRSRAAVPTEGQEHLHTSHNRTASSHRRRSRASSDNLSTANIANRTVRRPGVVFNQEIDKVNAQLVREPLTTVSPISSESITNKNSKPLGTNTTVDALPSVEQPHIFSASAGAKARPLCASLHKGKQAEREPGTTQSLHSPEPVTNKDLELPSGAVTFDILPFLSTDNDSTKVHGARTLDVLPALEESCHSRRRVRFSTQPVGSPLPKRSALPCESQRSSPCESIGAARSPGMQSPLQSTTASAENTDVEVGIVSGTQEVTRSSSSPPVPSSPNRQHLSSPKPPAEQSHGRFVRVRRKTVYEPVLTEESLLINFESTCIDCGAPVSNAIDAQRCLACGGILVNSLFDELFDKYTTSHAMLRPAMLPKLHFSLAQLRPKLAHMKTKSSRRQMIDTTDAFNKTLILQRDTGCKSQTGIIKKFFPAFLKLVATSLDLTLRSLMHSLANEEMSPKAGTPKHACRHCSSDLVVASTGCCTSCGETQLQRDKQDGNSSTAFAGTQDALRGCGATIGQKEFAEIVRLSKAHHIPLREARQYWKDFQDYDANGDSVLQREEFEVAIRDRFGLGAESGSLKNLLMDHWFKWTQEQGEFVDLEAFLIWSLGTEYERVGRVGTSVS